MDTQFSNFLLDVAFVMAMCLSMAVAAILVGIRIGTQRLAIPILAKDNALYQLDEANLKHMKARYLEQQHAWQRVLVLAGTLACIAGTVYLAYRHYHSAPHWLLSFLLANIMVFFLAAIGSTGYHCGARIGMVKAFKRASTHQLVALHSRLTKQDIPARVTALLSQLPKKKYFIHLMVVHYAIHDAVKAVEGEKA